MQSEDLPLGHDGAEPGAGAEQDAGGGVAQLQGQAGPRDVLELAGDVEDLVAGAAGGLGGCGQGVVGILMPGDNRQGRFDHVDDGAQVAGGLGVSLGGITGGLPKMIRMPSRSTNATSFAPSPLRSPMTRSRGVSAEDKGKGKPKP